MVGTTGVARLALSRSPPSPARCFTVGGVTQGSHRETRSISAGRRTCLGIGAAVGIEDHLIAGGNGDDVDVQQPAA